MNGPGYLKTASIWLGAALGLVLTTCPASAQIGCLKGNVLNPLGFNGVIKICPDYQGKVPELQKQLDDIQTSLNGNQEMLREMTRTARGVNALGRIVDTDRQVALLRSFSKELQQWNLASQQITLERMAQLADKLDALQDSIAQSKENEKTSRETAEALNGRLGDSIAALDLAGARKQLESIQAKLDKIGEDTQQIRRTLEERAGREKESADLEKKKAEELDQDPNMYTRAQIMPSRSPLNGNIRLMIYFYTRPPLYPPFIDSAFSIAFHKGSEAWRIDASDKQVSATGELWHVNLNSFGDRATFCFVAHDRPTGRLKEWKQRYKTSRGNSAVSPINFIPDGEAIMRLTDGEACDGVNEVRNELAEKVDATSLSGISATQSAQSDPVKQIMARMQEQLAAAREQARKTTPVPERFAHIRVEGSRRDRMNNGNWQIKVDTQPARISVTLYDERVEANVADPSGKMIPIELGNRQLFVNIESRYAWTNGLGTKAVVCLTGKDPAYDKPYRLTQWFTIETSRVYWRDGGAQIPGDKATFVPSQPPTLTEADGAHVSEPYCAALWSPDSDAVSLF